MFTPRRSLISAVVCLSLATLGAFGADSSELQLHDGAWSDLAPGLPHSESTKRWDAKEETATGPGARQQDDLTAGCNNSPKTSGLCFSIAPEVQRCPGYVPATSVPDH